MYTFIFDFQNTFSPISLFICCSVQLSQDMLDRPVESLLMNQANHYRETQEQREFLNRVMPLIHSGYVWHTFESESSPIWFDLIFSAASSLTRLYIYVLGLPCGQWVLEPPTAYWRWNEWHRSHSDSDGAGQMVPCRTRSTTGQRTPGIRYTQKPPSSNCFFSWCIRLEHPVGPTF